MKTVAAPPSKSVSHRALIAASLAQGTSLVRNALESEDLERTAHCLRQLGAVIKEEGKGAYYVEGIESKGSTGAETVVLDVGESGTTCRLLAAVAAAVGGEYLLQGRGRMHERPIGSLTRVLEQMGARIFWEADPGYPPLHISSRGLFANRVEVDLEQSSQYLSGLLLSAPFYAPVRIGVSGERAVSWPYVALTLQVMQDFGASFSVRIREGESWSEVPWSRVEEAVPGGILFLVNPGQYASRSYSVEGDWSNSSYFLAAGSLLRSGVRVTGLVPDSVQGDRRIVDILETMGVNLSTQSKGIESRPGHLRGADLDMGSCPDLVPTVSVLASLAEGNTRIRNVAHLRLKESDRLQAMAGQIRKTGAQVELFQDGMAIEPSQELRSGSMQFETHGDHRLAMSLSLYELAGIGVQLDQPGCVAKSFPDFWDKWKRIVEDD